MVHVGTRYTLHKYLCTSPLPIAPLLIAYVCTYTYPSQVYQTNIILVPTYVHNARVWSSRSQAKHVKNMYPIYTARRGDIRVDRYSFGNGIPRAQYAVKF